MLEEEEGGGLSDPCSGADSDSEDRMSSGTVPAACPFHMSDLAAAALDELDGFIAEGKEEEEEEEGKDEGSADY